MESKDDLKQYPFLTPMEQDSFARFTLDKRMPIILERIIESQLFDDAIQNKLKDLAGKIPNIQVKRLQLKNDEKPYWESFFQEYSQKELLKIPFLYAEIYFYKLILEIVDYHLLRIDPFSKTKEQDISVNLSLFQKVLAGLDDRSLEELIIFSLTGNKADLSQLNNVEGELNVIIDHTEELVAAIQHSNVIHIILDNAGVELFTDLLLTHHVLKRNIVKKVVLYPKLDPLLVSDATPKDIFYLLNVLKKIGNDEFSDLVFKWVDTGLIEIREDVFWNTPNGFTNLPSHILQFIKHSDVVIAKGDANYRRFFEDRKIPVDFKGAPVEFSDSQFALRTLKTEIVAGISLDMARQLEEENPAWLYCGKYAVIQHLN